MILLDRYLQTLRLFLPKAQRDDIIRELSGEIEAQVAEQEHELGRTLNLDEEAAILGRYGHPMLTAARYRHQQHLVGPLVFPYYWLLLRLVLVLVVAGHVVGAGVLLANGADWSEIGPLGERLLETSLKTGAWLTLLAAGAELWLARSGTLEKWNPRTLVLQPKERPVEPPRRAGLLRWPGRVPNVAAPSVSRLIVHVALGVWWLRALKFPILFFAGGADVVAWGPAMNRLYPVFAVALIAEVLQRFARLTHAHDKGVAQIAGFVLSVNSLCFLYLILTSDHQWVLWRGGVEPHGHVDGLMNNAFSVAFTVAALVGVAGTLNRVGRWFTANRHTQPSSYKPSAGC